MFTRRTALKTAVAAALAAQPMRNAAATTEAAAPGELPLSVARPLYSPDHPLAQGETVMIPESPRKPSFALEEVSRRTLHNGERMFVPEDAGAECLLLNRLGEEANRYVAAEWAAYKRELRKIEQLLIAAGVDHATMHRAIDDLDVEAVGLCASASMHMLDAGMEAGRMIATETEPFPFFMPGDRQCPACHGQGRPCATCESTGLVERGPTLMMIVIPDGYPLEEAAQEDAAAAA